MSLPKSGAVFAGTYRIDGEIGRGAMGVVYQAHHLNLDRKVALKVLPVALGWDDANRNRFLAEARLLAKFEHPNVVTLYDAGEEDGILYLAMAYVTGSDLHTAIEHLSPMPADQVIASLSQVGDALDFAHGRGLIHRDVKPSNILIQGALSEIGKGSAASRMLLADFGLAKQALTGRSVQYTLNFLGTPEYAAPEQLRGDPAGPSVDVYALGCVVYECLTGKRPFAGDNPLALMKAHEADPVPSLCLDGNAGSALDDVLATALAKSPEDRFTSCQELFDAAREAVVTLPRESPSRAADASTPRPAPRRRVRTGNTSSLVGADDDHGKATSSPAPDPAHPVLRHRALAAVAIVGIVAGTTGGIVASRLSSPGASAGPASKGACPLPSASGASPAASGVSLQPSIPSSGVDLLHASPWLGVQIGKNPTSIHGAFVVAASPRPPGELSCLGPGDVIVSVDSHAVSSASMLSSLMSTHKIGDKVKVRFDYPTGQGMNHLTHTIVLMANPTGGTSVDCASFC